MLDLDLITSKIIGNTFISSIKYFDEVDSTNNYAKNPELGDNLLVIAEFQSSGKGRLNRRWESNKGENLTFTIRKKFDIDAIRIQSVNFFFSYFFLKAIEHFLRSQKNFVYANELEIKWPNDILLDNKKLSGLLIENDSNRNFLIGIGLNANQRQFSKSYEERTTSLTEITGARVDRTELLINIIHIFNENLDLLLSGHHKSIYSLWISKCKVIGKMVDFTYPNNFTDTGFVVNVLRDGGIVLKIDNKDKIFYSGDIKIKNY